MLDGLFDWNEADISGFNFRQAAMDLGAPGFLYFILPSQAGKNVISQ